VKKVRQVNFKAKSILIVFIDIKRENLSWQAKQSVHHTTVTFMARTSATKELAVAS
jgi:hypothetical protein